MQEWRMVDGLPERKTSATAGRPPAGLPAALASAGTVTGTDDASRMRASERSEHRGPIAAQQLHLKRAQSRLIDLGRTAHNRAPRRHRRCTRRECLRACLVSVSTRWESLRGIDSSRGGEDRPSLAVEGSDMSLI